MLSRMERHHATGCGERTVGPFAEILGPHQREIGRAENAAVMGKDRDRADRQAVMLVDQHRIFNHMLAAILLAPLAQRHHCGQQIETLRRQPVFDLATIIGARLALEDAVFDQFCEAIGENVAGDPEFFMGEFASAYMQEGGEYFTSSSMVKLIVEVIESYHGKSSPRHADRGGCSCTLPNSSAAITRVPTANSASTI
jgi:hypothetical protein